MSASGISSLIAVTQLKSNQANEDALHGADKARDLVTSQRDARSRLRAFEDAVRDNNMTDEEYWNIARMMGEVGVDTNDLVDGSWDGILGYYDANGEWNAPLGDPANETAADNDKKVDGIRKGFEDAISDLEAQDKLGNFEIQDLMSRYNQNETLASSVLKKTDDTSNQVIGKV